MKVTYTSREALQGITIKSDKDYFLRVPKFGTTSVSENLCNAEKLT